MSSSTSEQTPLLGSINAAPPPSTLKSPRGNDIVQDVSPATKAASLPTHGISTAITRRLFISHFLSTWNSRVFEFGAVLFLASIFPKTLLPMSVYALSRGTSATIFSPSVGRYIDTGNRLQVVRLSIGNVLSPGPTAGPYR
jgi:hypothetical protein